PNLLPGGRPVADPAARVDAAATWGVEHLPDAPGRDGDAIVSALAAGELGGLVIGGVDPDDTADPAATRAALAAASFVVALEIRETEVTRGADVVFPVAPVADKAGTFVTWEGRPRPFEAVFSNPGSLPDLRILAGIADELAASGTGSTLGFRTVAEVRAQMEEMGPWDGERATHDGAVEAAVDAPSAAEGFALATWKLLVDNGSLQVGDEAYLATGRAPVARLSRAAYDAHGPTVTLTGDRGSVTLPAEPADLADDVVWVPANSFGNGVLADLASPGSRVTVKGAAQ
ncbi:MAG: molybdopterin-dependent oxidoreductase, partial [Nocardioides sp.]